MVNKFGISESRSRSYQIDKEVTIETGGVSQKYVDQNLFKLDGTSQPRGSMNMAHQKITNLGIPIDDKDAATKDYVSKEIITITNKLSQEIDKRLFIDGGTMNGILNMGNFSINNVHQEKMSTSVATVNFVLDSNKQVESILKKYIQEQMSVDVVKKLIDGVKKMIDIPQYIRNNANQYIEAKDEHITFSDADIHILELKDITGNDNNVYQRNDVDGIQPQLSKYAEQINNLNFIKFDGSSQFLSKLNLAAEVGNGM